MTQTTGATSLDEIVKNAVAPMVERASSAIAKAVANIVAVQLEARLQKGLNGVGARRGRRPAARRKARGEITKWLADKRAGRVPTFVIEATGMKTKKQIVAKYGENAAFEKGKAPPKSK